MYAGNASVVNLLMRFPALAPVAVAVGVVVVTPPSSPPPPTVAIIQPAPSIPVSTPTLVIKPVETLCPPSTDLTRNKLKKLPPEEVARLKLKNCIKG